MSLIFKLRTVVKFASTVGKQDRHHFCWFLFLFRNRLQYNKIRGKVSDARVYSMLQLLATGNYEFFD